MNRNIQWNSFLMKVDELKKDVEYLMNQNHNLQLIEIDIILNKLSLIYDDLMSLKLQTASNEENGFFSKNSSFINKIIKKSVFQSNGDLENNENKSTNFFENNATISNFEKFDTTLNEKIEKNNNYQQNEEKKINSIEQKPIKTIAESIAQPKKTIADIMEEIYKKQDVTSSQQFKSIKDLKHAISINDKIMFIRELFNNNVDNYNYVIDQVNSCYNLDEALVIIEKNVKTDSGNQALNILLELIYRRFMN